MNEIAKRIKVSIGEELAGIVKYSDLLAELKGKGSKQNLRIVKEIINDEYTHVEALIEILDIQGVNTEEYKRRLLYAKRMIEEL